MENTGSIMKKSLSAPSLVDLANSSAKVMVSPPSLTPTATPVLQSPTVRNVSCKASMVPYHGNATPELIFQVESMISTPFVQHVQCALKHQHQFPDILSSDNDKDAVESLAFCEAEPTDNTDFEVKRPNIPPRNRFFLSRCQDDCMLNERYIFHLSRLRKMKKNNLD